MTPKEKADELFTKFSGNTVHFDAAKQCALIAVDEILNAIEQIFETFEERKYWQEVKKEIEKL